jgi:hypothetical protein
MNKVKHTPGPWIDMVNLKQGAIPIIEANCGINKRCTICEISRYGEMAKVYKANARLIAAAPEILEALEAVYGEMVRRGFVGLLMENIKAAIQKAKGELK